MAEIQVLILRTAGTNCDKETCYAFELAGAKAKLVHINQLISKPDMLRNYQILALPGGFSYGDDIAAGKILANQIVHHLMGELPEFVEAGKLIIGICNGFQVLVKAGLLPGIKGQESLINENANTNKQQLQQATITYNDSGKFEDRWVYLQPDSEKCVFVRSNQRIHLPIAHGEGKVCFASEDVRQAVRNNDQVVFRYVDKNGQSGGYPINPNGSTDDIAGLCDYTGRVMGLMPHPERFVHITQHPSWTRDKIDKPDGISIFENAVGYFQ